MFIATVMLLNSCQTEQVIIKDSEGQTLESMSPLADLVYQTTLKDGSTDNIIDNSSCITVVLPVTVIANGIELVISTSDDYKLIERIFDESTTDTDVLEIIFPIKVVLPDFSELEVSDYDELEDITEDCLEGGEDNDIECLDFKYPISISVYNSNSQTSDIVTIHNDEELNEFIDELEDSQVFSFSFPITMLLSDSTEFVVDTNEELEELIDEVGDSCDEDDDDDYDDDDADTSELFDIMMSSAWVVTYYNDTTDHTAAFDSSIFIFQEDENAHVVLGDLFIEGEWELYGNTGALELELEYDYDYPFNLFDDKDWLVADFDQSFIDLIYISEDSITYQVRFEATDYQGIPQSTIADFIIDGDWQIALYKKDSVDETSNFADFLIDFTSDHKIIYSDGVSTHEGSWEETIESEEHQLSLEFGSVEHFEKLNEEWDVISYTEVRVELVYSDSDSGTTAQLVLEKIQ